MRAHLARCPETALSPSETAASVHQHHGTNQETTPVPGRLFTSESVTEGHPDKIADQISDSVLDEVLRQDPHSRGAVETLLTTGLVVVAGDVTASGYVDVKQVVRERILEIGYDSSLKGFDGASCGVMVAIGGQS